MKNRAPNHLTVIVASALTGVATGPSLHPIWAAPSLCCKMKGPGRVPAGRHYPTSGQGWGLTASWQGRGNVGHCDFCQSLGTQSPGWRECHSVVLGFGTVGATELVSVIFLSGPLLSLQTCLRHSLRGPALVSLLLSVTCSVCLSVSLPEFQRSLSSSPSLLHLSVSLLSCFFLIFLCPVFFYSFILASCLVTGECVCLCASPFCLCVCLSHSLQDYQPNMDQFLQKSQGSPKLHQYQGINPQFHMLCTTSC